MPHAPARRRGGSGDEAHHRLLHLAALQEIGGLFLGRAAHLSDHDVRLGGGIAQEHLQAVDEMGAVDRIAADADAGRLAEPRRRGLRHRLIGERSGAGDDADVARLVDMPRHDADLALARRDHARAIGADEARFGTREHALDLDHVEPGYALGDADAQRHFGVDRLQYGVGGEGRRHVDGAGIGAGGGHRVLHGVEHRQVEMLRAAFTRRDAAHHLGAVGDCLLGMKSALCAGEALAHDLGVAADQNRHQAASLTALTTLAAASARSSAARMGSPDSARIFLPSFTLVPSSGTPRGTCRLISRAAATTPSAITSHRMMPPKMLINRPSTWGSERMSLKAVDTRSLVAPPPTSRKFAGSPP